uniref:Uncharacterized protein n=1 Tax=Arundo donax TaxID=35708 RepID=A0A0A9DIE8_ARUDO
MLKLVCALPSFVVNFTRHLKIVFVDAPQKFQKMCYHVC